MKVARKTAPETLTELVRENIRAYPVFKEFTTKHDLPFWVSLHDVFTVDKKTGKPIRFPEESCRHMLQDMITDNEIERVRSGVYRRLPTDEEAMSKRKSLRLKARKPAAERSAQVFPFPESAAPVVEAEVREYVAPAGGPEANKELTYPELRALLKAPTGTRRLRILTPEIAQKIIDHHNVGNSRIQQASVDAYATDMANGAWEYTADPITFDIEGNMISGQHRCLGSIKSGVPILVDLIFGLPLSARSKRNTGKRDKPGDFLAIAGWKNAHTAAQAVRWLIIYPRSVGGAPQRTTFAPSHYPTLAKTFNRDDLDHCVKIGLAIHKDGVAAPPQHIAAVYYLAKQAHPDEADEFFGKWAEGTPAPILSAAQKMLNGMTNKAVGSNQSGTDWDKFVILVLAWNNWMSDAVRSKKALMWATNERVPELA